MRPPPAATVTVDGVLRQPPFLPSTDFFRCSDIDDPPSHPSSWASGAVEPTPRVWRERWPARASRGATCGRARPESAAACPISDVTSQEGVLRPGQWCCEPLWLGVSRVHACECVASLRGLVVVRGTIVVGLGRTPSARVRAPSAVALERARMCRAFVCVVRTTSPTCAVPHGERPCALRYSVSASQVYRKRR